MATTQQPEQTGTAVARTKPALPPEAQALIEQKRILNRVAAEITALTWGKDYNQVALRAIAEWGARHRVDVTTEIDVLGGRIYLNARFYLNRAAPLIQAGVITELSTRAIHHDARLVAIANTPIPADTPDADRADFEERRHRAKQELWQRENLRIEFAVPDHAVGAFVATCRLRGVAAPFVAGQWAGGRGMKTTKWGEKLKDPVGEERPVETAETRALRRVLRLIVSHVPQLEEQILPAVEEAGAELQEVMHDARATEAAQLAEVRQHQLQAGTIQTPEYVHEALAETPAQPVAVQPTRSDPYAIREEETAEAPPPPDDDQWITAQEQEQELALQDTRPARRNNAVRDGGR